MPPCIYYLQQKVDYPSDTDPSRTITTSYAYTYYPGTCAVQQRVTTLPVISAAQNGSGVANTRKDYYDTYGNLLWHMDERGYITNTTFDVVTGAVTQRIDDVDSALYGDSLPPGWRTAPGGGLNLITDITIDAQGRTIQVLGPWHQIALAGVATMIRRASWTVYQDADVSGIRQVWSAQGYAVSGSSSSSSSSSSSGGSPSYAYTLINPVSLSMFDANGRTLQSVQAIRSPDESGPLVYTDSFPQTSYVRWTTMQYGTNAQLSNNLLASQCTYYLIPMSGTGTVNVNYNQENFAYDVMQRQNKRVSGLGTISRTVFDVRDNVISTWTGTNDSGATDSDPTGGGAACNNMIQITSSMYDDNETGQDNNLTTATQFVDWTTRVTEYIYDFRNRRTDIDGEEDFYQVDYYDNLDRVYQTERYDTSLEGNLIALGQTNFDDLSRAYQTIVYAVDPSTGDVGNSLTGNTWYDPAGNILMSLPAGSQLFTMPVFDGLNRQTVQYQGYSLSGSSSSSSSSSSNNYPIAGDVTNAIIMEQRETAYDAASNVIQTTARFRYHTETATGRLGNPSTAPLARVTYQASWPDALGRVISSTDYGTNGGTPLVYPSTPPASTNTSLVTTNAFNNAGDLCTDTDPMGMPTCWVYDNEGRQVKQQINCQGSSSSSSSSSSGFPASCDTDVTTLTGYNADSNVSTTTAMNLGQGQVTTDGYVTAVTNAAVASSQLLSSVTYPDSTTKPDQVSYKYNRLGQVVWKTDQSGTQHYYTYDGLGRLRQDCVFLAVGSPVDNAVLRIETSYEVRGMVSGITSYDNPKPGSGNVVNDVQRVYNGFGQLVAEYQSHDGEVDFEETPSVEYGYADGSANTIRPTSVTYPDGRVLNYNYGTPGQMNDLLSRIASLIDSDGITHLGDYFYLGLGTIILVSSVQPNIQFNLVGFGGGTDPVTGDIYQGLDSFGRVKDLIWNLIGTTTTLEEIQHGYDLVGNRIWRAEPVDASDTHDEFYTYDGIHRLQNLSRGSLNSGKTGINGQTFGQSWALDDVGNWSSFMQNDAGTITSQTRTSNLANEILSITAISGPAWATPAYDLNGNMTSMPQPANPGQSYAGVYDAWNRLVKLQEGGSGVGLYAYDGLNRRTTKVTNSGTTSRDYYYSSSWQVLEERVLNTSSSSSSSGPEPEPQPDRQFVWGLRYIDDLLLRDRAPSGSGPLTERFYGIQDPNWNVTAICNSSGVVQERYDYDAYGVPTVLSASFVPLLESAYDWETLFAGYRWDDESGLYQVRNRIYTSLLGSWAQRDPVEAESTLYRYASNNAINRLDPSGLWRITRDGQPTATAVAQNGDTIQSLADIIGLDARQNGAWLRPANNIPTNQRVADGQRFTIPNTIVGIYAINAWRDVAASAVGGIVASFNSSMSHLRAVGFRVVVENVRPTWTDTTPTAGEILDTITGQSQRAELQGLWYAGHGVTDGMQLRWANWVAWSDPVVLRWQTVRDALRYRLGLVVANACSSEQGSFLLTTGTRGSIFKAFEGWVSSAWFWSASSLYSNGEQGTVRP